MPIEKIKPSFFFDEEKLKELKALLPEAFADGKINWNTLKEALGEHLEDDGRDAEHFGLFWPGKREARRLTSIPSTGTLVPVKGEGINENSTSNIFIEGENLEVLKILRKSYAGRIKMIYIDPPYNTGNDFVYDDNFTEPLEEYLRRTAQTDEEGKPLTTNKKSDGRFHSKWLSMMYPRLKLARELLRDDGVIFVSIDNNEIHNLRTIIGEIFGEENFISIIANTNNPKGRSDDNYIATAHDYIVVVAKNISELKFGGFEPEEKITKRYNKRDSQGKLYREMDLRKTGDEDRRSDRPDMFYYFYYYEKSELLRVSRERDQKKGEIEIIPLREDNSEGRWRWGFDTAVNQLDSLTAHIMPTRKIWGVFEYDYLEGRDPVKATSSWTFKDVNSERGSEQFIELGFEKEVFPKPKPIGTIKRLSKLGITYSDSIVLDFFAGSATTAQAVMEYCFEDHISIKYILVQLPQVLSENEKNDKPAIDFLKKQKKPLNIAEIAKERIRRSIKKITKEFKDDLREYEDIIGFNVYKLTKSTFKPWENYNGEDIDVIEDLFSGQVTPLVEDWKEDDLFTEILLIEGFPLDSVVEPCNEYKSNTVKKVSSSFSDHKLFISLDKKINPTTIKDLNLGENDIFVCLDSAVNDEAKARLADKGLIKTI